MILVRNVTKWYKVSEDKDGNIKKTSNHYEEGLVTGDYPLPFKPEYTNQVAWKNDKWEYEHAHLIIMFDETGKIKRQIVK